MSEYIVGTDGHAGYWLTNETIVRCRDCKHRYTAVGGFVDIFGEWYCQRFEIGIDPDFFCAAGEYNEERP